MPGIDSVPWEAYSGIVFVLVYIAVLITAVLWNQ